MHGTPLPYAETANWPEGPFVCAQCRRPIYGNAYARQGVLDDDGQALLWCADACLAAWDAARAGTSANA